MVAEKHAKFIYNDPEFREFLKNYGVVHIPAAIGIDLIHHALYEANYKVGQLDPAISAKNSNRAQFHSTDSKMQNLYHKTFLPELMHSLVGVSRPMYEGPQIPIRFPDDLCEKNWTVRRRDWHIDNIAHTGDGGHYKKIYNFDATVSVILSDNHGRNSGELVTYLGSHRILGKYFSENRSMYEDIHKIGLDALPRGEQTDEVFGSKPYHCLGRAGDIFILNYMNAHLPNCNDSPYIRYAAYFRFGNFPNGVIAERSEEFHNPLKAWHL